MSTLQQAVDHAEAINRYQQNRWVHPLTCGNPVRTATHVLDAVVYADYGRDGTGTDFSVELKCPVCGWRQPWFPLMDFTTLAEYDPFTRSTP